LGKLLIGFGQNQNLASPNAFTIDYHIRYAANAS